MGVYRYRVLLTLVLGILACARAIAQTNSEVLAEVAGKWVRLPLTPGYADALAVPELRSMTARFVPPGNRLVAYIVEQKDLNAYRTGQELSLDNYFVVQAPADLRTATLPFEEFGQLHSYVKREHINAMNDTRVDTNNMLRDASKDVGREYGTKLNLEVGQSIPLGIVEDKPNWIAFGNLTQFTVAIGDKQETGQMIVVSTFAHVQGRLLYVYFYRTFERPYDIEIAKEKTVSWLNALAK
jgi:hypothetical protein